MPHCASVDCKTARIEAPRMPLCASVDCKTARMHPGRLEGSASEQAPTTDRRMHTASLVGAATLALRLPQHRKRVLRLDMMLTSTLCI